MTTDKVLEVTKLYREKLFGLGVSGQYPFDLDHRRHIDDGEDEVVLRKAKEMLDPIDNFIVTGQREKAMRWLGFVQGLLFTAGVYSIAEMTDHNRMEA